MRSVWRKKSTHAMVKSRRSSLFLRDLTKSASNNLLALQRRIGNMTLGRLLTAEQIQFMSFGNAAEEKYEQEGERAASMLTSRSDTALHHNNILTPPAFNVASSNLYGQALPDTEIIVSGKNDVFHLMVTRSQK